MKPIYYQNVTVNLAYFPMRLRDRCRVFARRGRQLHGTARKIESLQPVAMFAAEEHLRVEAAAGMRLLCARKCGALCLRLAALVEQDSWTPGMQRRCLSSFRKRIIVTAAAQSS